MKHMTPRLARNSLSTRRVALVGAVAAAALVAGSLTAVASPLEPPVEIDAQRIANHVHEVAPPQGSVVTGTGTGSEYRFALDAVNHRIPKNPDAAMHLTGVSRPDGAVDGVADLSVTLPTEVELDQGQAAADGSIVYPASDGEADVVVQALDDGSVRMQTVQHIVQASYESTYEFEKDLKLRRLDDGSIDVIRDAPDAGTVQVVGTIDQPWAYDANGTAQETFYRVDHNKLIQVVEPSASAQYPIVADPRITVGVGVYLYLNKPEGKAAFSAIGAISAVGAGATCAVYGARISKVPLLGGFVSHLCGFVSASALYKFFTSGLPRITGGITASCYEMRYFNGWTNKTVASSHCKPLSQSGTW
jgi:hypothetical protein